MKAALELLSIAGAGCLAACGPGPCGTEMGSRSDFTAGPSEGEGFRVGELLACERETFVVWVEGLGETPIDDASQYGYLFDFARELERDDLWAWASTHDPSLPRDPEPPGACEGGYPSPSLHTSRFDQASEIARRLGERLQRDQLALDVAVVVEKTYCE